MNRFVVFASTVAVVSMVAAPAFSNPTATESQLNATTVDVRDMIAPSQTTPAPRIGLAPSAPDWMLNGTTIDASRGDADLVTVSPANRIGVSPSATRAEQDSSWVNPFG